MTVPLLVAVVLLTVMEGLATLARGVLFTAAVCLATFASALLLAGGLRVAGAAFGQTWARGIVAILVFVVAVGGTARLLSRRFPVDEEPDDPQGDDDPAGGVEPGGRTSEGDHSGPTEP